MATAVENIWRKFYKPQALGFFHFYSVCGDFDIMDQEIGNMLLLVESELIQLRSSDKHNFNSQLTRVKELEHYLRTNTIPYLKDFPYWDNNSINPDDIDEILKVVQGTLKIVQEKLSIVGKSIRRKRIQHLLLVELPVNGGNYQYANFTKALKRKRSGKNDGYICDSTTVDQVRELFVPFVESRKKILWTGSKGELKALITALVSKSFISNQFPYSAAQELFEFEDGPIVKLSAEHKIKHAHYEVVEELLKHLSKFKYDNP